MAQNAPIATIAAANVFGGSQRLPRRVGPARAKWLLMTGERLKAEDALRIGLVDRVVPHDTLMAEARKTIDACIANGPLAMSCVKRLVDDGLHLPLRDALELEADMFGDCFGTQDQKEGMNAFLEKRKPAFKGA
ncbi:MAG: enoyl-CoA hydratase/isomerase family protein [Thermoplasmatota archaeon]